MRGSSQAAAGRQTHRPARGIEEGTWAQVRRVAQDGVKVSTPT